MINGKRADFEVYDELPDPRLMTEAERIAYVNQIKEISNRICSHLKEPFKGQVMIFGTSGNEEDADLYAKLFYSPNTYSTNPFPVFELKERLAQLKFEEMNNEKEEIKYPNLENKQVEADIVAHEEVETGVKLTEVNEFPSVLQENLADQYANELVEQLNNMSEECRNIIINKLKVNFY